MQDLDSSQSSVPSPTSDEEKKLDNKVKQEKVPRKKWLSKVLGDIYAEDNPVDLSKGRKIAIVLVVAVSGVFAPLASMIYMPSLVTIADALNTSAASVNATVSTYVVCMGVAVSHI